MSAAVAIASRALLSCRHGDRKFRISSRPLALGWRTPALRVITNEDPDAPSIEVPAARPSEVVPRAPFRFAGFRFDWDSQRKCDVCRRLSDRESNEPNPCTSCRAEGYTKIARRAYVLAPPSPDEIDDYYRARPGAEPPPFATRALHEVSRMEIGRRVTVDDVLAELAGRGGRLESNISAVLSGLERRSRGSEPSARLQKRFLDDSLYGWEGTSPPRSVYRQRPELSDEDEPEKRLERDANALRCLADLARVRETSATAKDGELARICEELQRESRSTTYSVRRSLGELVVRCLRAHEERASTPHRALAAVWAWREREGSRPDVDPVALAEAFAAGREKETKAQAAALHAEALTVLRRFVTYWNRKNFGPPTKPTPRWMGTDEAAALMGVSERTVRRWCDDRELPASKKDGRFRIHVHDLTDENRDLRTTRAPVESEGAFLRGSKHE